MQGSVTIDGQLANQGTVVFHPVDEGPTAYGSIDENGSFSLRVGQGDLEDANASAVPVGEYIITVVVNMPSRMDETVAESGPPTPGARLTGAKYADKETSDLRRVVKVGHNVVPLELEAATEHAAESPETSAAEDVAEDASPLEKAEVSSAVEEPPAPADEAAAAGPDAERAEPQAADQETEL